ncbi:hypothetical protein AB0L35_15700 [Streptomyces sp. NPDC052309]|uniref:Uncharacterized protein n=1 Tax=Streptomyces griseicoloratus TaxID=2752516 RepID=A0A926L7A1_9ACTN|nr:hypothetical protein [Streptomyces griseicoloratus]MBD0421482.1 hypothetical protein [Streptomyces griseicoloratus]
MTEQRRRPVRVQVPPGVDVAERRRRSQERERAEAEAREGAGEGPSQVAYDFLLGQAGGRRDAAGLAAPVDGEDVEERPPQEEEVTVVTSQLLRKLGRAGTTCPVCHHSFRLGEQISIHRADTGPGVVLKHHSRRLDCLNPGTGEAASAVAEQFHRGLDEANPPPPELSTVRLRRGHPLLRLHPGPGDGAPTRHRCWVCGHTFRPDEVVIHCTCSPHAPACACAVHRDPDHGLVCYDDWKAQHPAVPCLMLNAQRDAQ